MGTIFVGGVHGVGKTETCRQVAKELCVPHHSASELIKALQPSAVSINSKLVEDVGLNQLLLQHAIRDYYSKGRCRLLLDGHFSVLTKSAEIMLIPLEVFRDLRIDCIAMILDAPESIQKRRLLRGDQLDIHEKIAFSQNAEFEHAHSISKSLSVPLFGVTGPNTQFLKSIIHRIWKDL